MTKPFNETFAATPQTVFETMSKLSAKYNSVNLGQGFPDEEGPETMKVIAGKSLMDNHNQYPPMLGLPELREAVAAHSLANQGIACDPASEVVITSGATEGIAACMLGLLNPGDEVIILDPCYDSYVGMALRAGGVVKPLRLRSDDMSIPLDDLENAFGPKTKLIMFNSPHNPSGKVFSNEEMQAIARLCIQHDVIAVCDEVGPHSETELVSKALI
ncbi:pyridoxal phosphate-dependent transferase [Dunaliella salina]|uniref:Pyridoxal phosphate-dependent transferase n=1 Tax=Dunaliella salina TaxID=3046 RepID=A0ABQ7H8W9_DUNSA|nr:pyridoxal phosphate-dependent transferase [Dunaliella salina]|eukprot:KAF5843303.1 pyridoxal phosphate-dependent transferase [Dunaliella salina]